MILSAIAAKLKRRSKDDFKGRHFEAALIVQAVSWYLRYPLSYRDIEELFLERGLAVDHCHPEPLGPGLCAADREPAAVVPQATLRLDSHRRDLHQDPRPVALPLPGHRQARHPRRLPADRQRAISDAAKRFFRKMLKDEPCSRPTGSARMAPAPIRPPSRRPGKRAFYRTTRSITSPSTCSKASRATISGSSGRCRGSAAFTPSTRHDARSGGSRPCCGCARALASRAPGLSASRTGCSRSASDF